MVTAETALALPALVVVLAGLLTVIVAVTAQLRCVAAAREGARAAARGEAAAIVQQAALRAAPDGATVEISTGADTVTVTVTAGIRPLGLSVAEIFVSGAATAQREPTADDGPSAIALGMVLTGLRPSGPRARPGAWAGRLRRAGSTDRYPRRPVGTRAGEDRGSGTFYVASAITILSAVVAGVVLVGKAHAAHARAAAAADLAALAAAQVLLDGAGDPCGRAGAIAQRNRAVVDACLIDGETVVVTASVPVELGGLGVLSATARARAGPVPEPNGR
ncbi:Rv3654c family TadE-like protein [Blastococcus sp. Marseille-P5729]|uniref:Rv3654c family TadE-like protein n=1 Tax=Blastococcus sp. Marseille-P5729 TaxID=2086582 RepID=UPI0018FE2DA1|nr:Rv3654c family TadE-like protein [Blastococcus sp. Marseille-P5729]